MIEGVLIEERKVIANDKGDVLHMLRCDDELFDRFGEVYFSYCEPGIVKGWKKHTQQTQRFVVPVGNLKLVIFDDRSDSSTKDQVQEICLGLDQYVLVRIPCGVWYSFCAQGSEKALIANCTDIPHDPAESLVKKLTDTTIPYSWENT